jgi:hypothetical protein
MTTIAEPRAHALEVASRPVFVVGHPRSGTTWTYDLLASHPAVAGVFESALFLRDHIGVLADRFAPIIKGISTQWDPAVREDFTRHRWGPAQLIDRDTAVASFRDVTTSWLANAVSGEHELLVEKTPGHDYSLPLLAELFPAARVVLVVRNGLDVAASTKAEQKGFDPRWPGGRYASIRWARRAGKQWGSWVTFTERVAREIPLPVHEIRYETLHAQPHDAVTGLYEFCGLEWDDELVADVVARNDIASIPGRGEGRFFRAGRVGDGRRQLTRLEQAVFEGAAADALVANGYLMRPGGLARFSERVFATRRAVLRRR